MEVDCGGEAFFISEAAATDFDGFDSAVNAFSGAITALQDDGINDPPEVFFDGFAGLFHRFQPAAHGPGQPPVTAFFPQVRLT